ncbi:MAG: nitrate reductase [Yaniella sp.]|uniref:uracil-xanthine permease family protein n=1 Tax=Yaniella sp. TaxID=2773929 RepID=UPI002648572D|nr:solute carrier family 23 protein [Yaniella sp.]MDN5704647.1 nitrate reductase [Yaniella sp.]MDN5742633.1 nitrate reductase [Yaniella sp.]MDN5814823.1 nitrate reductase [Yaniella sp.]MDN6456733.1 nitrate reductase [Yaniella sp.]MDN6489064.1 nitrate reductase [Yaniella sp.]
MAASFRKRWGLTWDIHGDGKTINAGQVVKPHERMAWPQTIGIGLQHVMAMFGSTVLVPALTGFPPTAALFFSGVGTLLFLVITKGKVPSYLGSSFAFIAPMVAATSMHSMAVASGGIIITGLALAIVGFIVHKAGTRWIHAVMPPVVMGTILALIGLNLAGATTEGMIEVPLTTFGTTAAVIITAVLFRGFLGRLSILLGIVVGYLLALAQQQIDFQPVTEASWIGLPAFHAPEFQFDVLFLFLPVVFVLVAENIGHVRTVGLMTRNNLDPHNGRALIADGLATMLSGSGGGVGTTTYAENIGVMASSRIYSTAAYWVAGIVAMSLAFFPKFGALIATIPMGVAAGAGIILYGMIGIMGARIWVNNEVDFSNTINLMAAGSGLIIAIADPVVEVAGMQFGGIALGTLAALGIYHLMTAIARWRNTEPIEEDDFEAVEPGRIG